MQPACSSVLRRSAGGLLQSGNHAIEQIVCSINQRALQSSVAAGVSNTEDPHAIGKVSQQQLIYINSVDNKP